MTTKVIKQKTASQKRSTTPKNLRDSELTEGKTLSQ